MELRRLVLGVGLLSLMGCGGEITDADELGGASADVGVDQANAALRSRRRAAARAAVPATTSTTATTSTAATGTAVTTRFTADGEPIRVAIPPLAPVQEVPAGGTCGVFDANGVLLSCMPGTFCLAQREGEPGTCQRAPAPAPTSG